MCSVHGVSVFAPLPHAEDNKVMQYMFRDIHYRYRANLTFKTNIEFRMCSRFRTYNSHRRKEKESKNIRLIFARNVRLQSSNYNNFNF